MSGNRGAANLARRVPFERGNTASLVHGAQATLQLRPRALEIAEMLRPALPDLRPIDEPTLAVLALTLARIERAADWLDRQDELVQPGRQAKPWPVLDMLSRWENAAVRLVEKLAPRTSEAPSGQAVLAAYLERLAAEREGS